MPVTPTVFFPKFLCHMLAVERVVRLITKASKVVCGQKLRDGFIRSHITSRHLMSTFEIKRDSTHLLCNSEILNGKSEEVVQILSFKISFSGKMSVYSLGPFFKIVHFYG